MKQPEITIKNVSGNGIQKGNQNVRRLMPEPKPPVRSGKKRLFKWILDSIELVDKYIELFRKLKMIIERSIGRSPDSHFRASDFSEILIYKESFSEECMNILEVDFRETNFSFIIDNIFDSIFMIQDHLGFCLCFSVC